MIITYTHHLPSHQLLSIQFDSIKYIQNISSRLFFQFWGVYVEMEFLDHIINVGLIFWKLTGCFLKQVDHFTFPSVVLRGSNFSTSFPTLVTLFFNSNHLNQYELFPHCCLIWISLMVSNVESLSMYILATCISSLEKCLFKCFAVVIVV